MGIGYKEREGRIINRCCIRVHVRKKFFAKLLPIERLLPKEINGIPIDVTEGDYNIQASGDPTKYSRTLKAGIQIANKTNYPKIGTLGCWARDELTDDLYILSNWHVLYGRTDASDDEPVVQPRRFGNRNVIGYTIKGIINNKVDCALARHSSNRGISESILDIPFKITGYKRATLGLDVIKSGVNGIARGVIDAIDFDITLQSPIGEIKFEDQIHVAPRRDGDYTLNVDEGDSGAVWISEEDNKIIGLHTAGIPHRKAISNHFIEVITAFESEGIYLKINH